MGEFISAAAEHFNAGPSAMVVWPLKRPEAFLPFTHGISREEVQTHFENRIYPDSLFGKLAVLPAGETFIAEGLSAGSEYASMEVLAGVVTADERNRCGIFFARSNGEGEFLPAEHETLRALMGFFRRAVDLNRRFVKIFNLQKTAFAVLNSAPRGVFALGQKGQIIHMNSEARRILDGNDGIKLSGDLIKFHDDKVQEEVDKFIAYAREVGELPGKKRRLSHTIKRHSISPAYQITGYSLPFKNSQALMNEDEALAALIIYDPTYATTLTVEDLMTFYALTPAEARLAELLCRGISVPDAALALEVSVNTARSQLRAVFKKVGVSSQGALLNEFARALKFPV